MLGVMTIRSYVLGSYSLIESPHLPPSVNPDIAHSRRVRREDVIYHQAPQGTKGLQGFNLFKTRKDHFGCKPFSPWEVKAQKVGRWRKGMIKEKFFNPGSSWIQMKFKSLIPGLSPCPWCTPWFLRATWCPGGFVVGNAIFWVKHRGVTRHPSPKP